MHIDQVILPGWTLEVHMIYYVSDCSSVEPQENIHPYNTLHCCIFIHPDEQPGLVEVPYTDRFSKNFFFKPPISIKNQ